MKNYLFLWITLTPALDRLLDDTQIENPLTAKIKERHPKEFAMAEILENDAIESIYHKDLLMMKWLFLHYTLLFQQDKNRSSN